MTREPHVFLAPWPVSRKCETSFSIKHKIPSPNSVSTPLSSERAFGVLTEFALLHELGSQLPVSLATALTIPLHKYYSLTAHLPFPRATGGKESSPPPRGYSANMAESYRRATLLYDYKLQPGTHDIKSLRILLGFWGPLQSRESMAISGSE